ncbi:hypothetical protein [Streptomyces jumonjinensis]|uniref:hypothetical protein n=1 Tax=Streptomyces jumonjinensis TaxID=1945 RepID=UPI0037A44C8C
MSERTAPDPADSPATLLGPVALFFGMVAALGLSVPAFFFLTPLAALAGTLAIAFGVAGIHYGRHGVGRLWLAVSGTVLGFGAFGTFVGFLMLYSA